MNRIHLKAICLLIAFSYLMSGTVLSFTRCFADEGLSDSQLYGYGSENVLGHKKKKKPGQVYNKENIYQSETPDATTEDLSDTLEEVHEEIDDTEATTEYDVVNDAPVKLLDIKVTGAEDNHYYNDEIDISVDVSGLTSGDAVDAVVLKKTFDGNVLRHKVILNNDEDRVYGTEKLSAEGEYNLDVQVVNGLEVLKHLNRQFVLDMTPPKFNEKVFDEMASNQIDVPYLISSAFSDATACETTVSINDRKVEGGIIKDEGEYDVTVTATDKAGNETSISECVLIDGKTNDKKIIKQNMYHQLIGVTLLVGTTLFYFERKKVA